MKGAWCWLALLLACCALATNWDVTLSATSLVVKENGSEIANVAVSASDAVVTAIAGSLAVQRNGTAASFTDLAAVSSLLAAAGYSASSCSWVDNIAPGLYRCAVAALDPATVYLIDNGAGGIMCGPALRSSPGGMTCQIYANSALAYYATIFDAAGASSSGVTLSLTVPAVTGTSGYPVVAVAMSHAVEIQQALVDGANIAAWNAQRLAASRVAIGFLYFWVAVGMCLVAAVCAVWQAWLHPFFPRHPIVIWTVIFIVIMHGVSWAGGMVGWIVILVIFGVYIIAAPISYACMHFHRKKRMATSVAPVVGQRRAVPLNVSQEPPSSPSQHSKHIEAGTKRAPPVAGAPTAGKNEFDAPENTSGTESGDHKHAPAASHGAHQSTPPAPKAKCTRECICGRGGLQFTVRPQPMVPRQGRLMVWYSLMAWIVLILCLICFFAYKLQDYWVWDRAMMTPVIEITPTVVGKTIAALYNFNNFASIMRVNFLLASQTKACGIYYSQILSDSEKEDALNNGFILPYKIDMNMFARPHYTQYSTVNDWFTRELAPGVRPVSSPTNDSVIVSVADCRLTIIPKMSRDASVWLKGEEFTLDKLLDGHQTATALFAGGDPTVAIFRLAPADYHRTHAPVSGTVRDQYFVASSIYSVGADAMRSDNGAIYNQRQVTIIDAAGGTRPIAFVAIGATCVGSVETFKKVGDTMTKGEVISQFKFGGSTVVAVFPPDSVAFDPDLVQQSALASEALVRVNTKVATWLK